MNLQVLQQLGMSERDITLYLALFQLGPSSIRDIASHTGINRGTTYEALKQMAARGLISYAPKGKRRFFRAEEPDKLLELAEEKRASLEQTIDSLKTEIIPGLHHLKPEFSSGNVRFYEGDDGIEFVLKDILATVGKLEEKTYSVFSTKSIRHHLYRPFPNYTAQRIKQKINVRVIALGEGGEDAEYSERKWLKTDGQVDASYIAIYPPKVAMISMASENYPVATVIESPDIARAQQVVFEALWRFL
ncbi:TrmB family transcriptional regulator [Parendozoicomonas haliclonae]|uniref:Sugar-specific transcriptional regulator TrmB n=1 Tax=Parendozoicomonas haliclonae TaxID=1960125 RepID=A0A1X7AJJ2_9GAMM|nr:helix-turn-helix domain-containing protein [Parendozoicomonas haliclonae]SMA46610.1 Sugar-specific transcriptional regulator TrmB [Parendozoicomonas haliclonae]